MATKKQTSSPLHHDSPQHGNAPAIGVAASWGPASKSLKNASRMIGLWQLLLIILFERYSAAPVLTSSDPGTLTQGYQYYVGVEIMM
jgi:hypothetical protein